MFFKKKHKRILKPSKEETSTYVPPKPSEDILDPTNILSPFNPIGIIPMVAASESDTNIQQPDNQPYEDRSQPDYQSDNNDYGTSTNDSNDTFSGGDSGGGGASGEY